MIAVLCGLVTAGCAREKGDLVTAASAKKPDPILWKLQTGGRITSSPVVMDGVVYFGSDDHKVYAVDARNGATKWTFPADAPVRSTPRMAGSVMYVGSNSGTLYALDRATGRLLWTFATPVKQGQATLDEWDYYDSSPAIDESEGTLYFGSADSRLYAIRATDGKELWRFQASAPIKSSPVVGPEGVYVGDWAGVLYGIDKKDGQQLWSYRTPANGRHVAIQSSPALHDGVLYWGCRNFSLYAMDAPSACFQSTSSRFNEALTAAAPGEGAREAIAAGEEDAASSVTAAVEEQPATSHVQATKRLTPRRIRLINCPLLLPRMTRTPHRGLRRSS